MDRDPAEQFPVRAVNFVRSHPVSGPIFNNYSYGGYIVGNLPEHKVFIDGREDLYEFEGVMDDFLQATYVRPAVFSILKSYGIRAILLDQNETLAVVLADHPDWKRIYKDETSVIFVRRDPAGTLSGARGSPPISARSEHEPAIE